MLFKIFSHISLFQQLLLIIIITFVCSLILYPLVIKALRKKKLGQIIRTLGPQTHQCKKGTPTMGGIVFVIIFIFIGLLVFPLNNIVTWIFILTSIFFAAIGLIDDSLKVWKHHYDGVTAKQKFILQFICASIVSIMIYYAVGSDIYIPFTHTYIHVYACFYIFFAAFIITSWVNAFNLTDGMDGLVSGLYILALIPIITVAFFSISGKSNPLFYMNKDIIIIIRSLAIIVPTIFIFIFYNKFPAKIFMGDTGSLFLGGLFAIYTLLLKIELLSVFIGFLFILENISVIIQVLYYKTTKKRFFKMAPLHHHFELSGLPEKTVVHYAWFTQFILSIIIYLILILTYI